MVLPKKPLLVCLSLQIAATAVAAEPSLSKATKARSVIAPSSAADRYVRRCQPHDSTRDTFPQGTELWGTKRGWRPRHDANEQGSVLVSVDLDHPRLTPEGVKAVRLEGGHLVAAPATPGGVIGTVLRGTAGDGSPVEVALCGAEPSAGDPNMVWYRIEAWNPVAQQWENPCAATGRIADPRALAVGGVWDASGAHHAAKGKLTFACEGGVITKCINWGYKPWASHAGHSLTDLHQACTRMARADYCGNGRSHTHEDTRVDIYDSLGVLSRTTEATADWDPALASFEAAWTPEGASCLARTRDGRAIETILAECPGRLEAGVEETGAGERCAVRRKGGRSRPALLWNQAYAKSR